MDKNKVMGLVIGCVLLSAGCSSDNGKHHETINSATDLLVGGAAGALVSGDTDWGGAPIAVGALGSFLIGASTGQKKDKIRYEKYPELSRGFQK